MEAKLYGKIKFWSETKHYGFIQTENNADLFCHLADIEGFTPEKFMLVEYELGTDTIGRVKAVKVKCTNEEGVKNETANH